MPISKRELKDFSREAYREKVKICMEQMLGNGDKDLCGLLISGYTGTGKTFLVESLLKEVELEHPVLIARHNQQHEGIPYLGFKNGISYYLSKIYKQFSKTDFQNFSTKLKHKMGGSFPLLLDYIPELSLLAGKAELAQKPVPKIENQLYPLFKSLFEFLAEYYQRPVFFFTDDLQWIDGPGINLLKYLIINLSPDKLIWIGACRSPQENVIAVEQLGEALGLEKKYLENIFLEELNPDQAGKLMEALLGSPCHDGLVEIGYELSGGNPSHLLALLESLRTSDLMWLQNGVWQCDKNAVKSRFEGQNSQIMFRERIASLTEPTREMLSIVACMGMFSRKTIKDWLKNKDLELENLILEAKEAGLIEKRENSIRFSEMHIGEMIYNDLSSSRKADLHYRIAKLIYSRGVEKLDNTNITLMTTHFNHSLKRVKANGELLMCAALNYKAGALAKQDNALDQARYFFKISGDLLKECPRTQVKKQIWDVYMERAKVEYYLGEYDLAEIHLDYLLELFADPLKRASVFELKIVINNHLGRYRKVVQILKESIRPLGLELPAEEAVIKQEVEQLKLMLTEQEKGSAASLMASIDEEAQKALLNLLNVGGMGLHHTSDVLMTWAALHIILLSGTSKILGVKAIGYVSYGRMLIISGNIDKGLEFGAKGLAINNSLKDISLRCRVYGVYAFYIKPWKNSFAESMELLEEGIQAGRAAGDLIGIYILKTHQLNLHFISGLRLQELLKWSFEESSSGTELTYYITHYQKSLVRFLVGESSIFSIPRQEPSWLAGKLTIQEEKFYRNYVWARYYFLFGHYELAENAAREAHMNRKLQEGSPLVPANLIIWSLSITQNWNNFHEKNSEELNDILQEILQSVELWKENAPSNYESSWWLLKGEWLRIHLEPGKAVTCYKKALETAGDNLYNAAVANELMAKYFFNTPGKNHSASKYFLQAIHLFTAWGAVTKSKQLIQQYQSLLWRSYPESQEMDIETIQHELSGDMEVASLVKKLMVLLLTVSGSTRVVIDLVENTGEFSCYGDLSLFYTMDAEKTLNGNTGIPVSMGLMAHRLQQPVIVNDLDLEKGLRDLEAVRQRGVQSFLVVPVTINGHFSLVITLENALAKNWYSQERLRWIRITANQGAVIIENARIYERSVKLNEEILKEMAEKEKLATLIEAQKDSHLKDMVQTQDNERKRIASDLHDSLGSLLSSVKLRFNGLQEEVAQNLPGKINQYNDNMALLDEAIQELRRIAHNMSPVALKRFGLKAALYSFLEQINVSEQLETDLQILGLERRLPEEFEIAAYRICQELVQNVIRHSKSPTIRIQLIDHIDSLNIIVEDKGIGMDPSQITAGFGFNTIHSKVSMLKGTFSIESKPGEGTMVLVDFPLPG